MFVVPLPSERCTARIGAAGIVTPGFAAAGRYGVWVRHVETQAGERDGQKYEEVRRYATLVVDLDPAKK